MDLDSLNALVTSAIWRAEQLDEHGVGSARLAWAEVSLLEEELAGVLALSEPEGRIARRGAVRAALKAGDYRRAQALAERFTTDAGAPKALQSTLRKMLEEDSRALAGRFRYVRRGPSVLHRQGDKALIRILLADDHEIFREGVRGLLDALSDMTVVGEAGTGEEALATASESRPDVVVLDVSMPGRGGLEMVSELKRRNPKVRVLMLTVHPEDRFAVRCLKGGADGYMTKDNAAEELIGAIRKVYAGGKYVSPSLAESLVLSLDRDFGSAPHEALSEREFHVMRMIASARTVSQIAEELCLSVKTISTYRSRILVKLGLRNDAEIKQYAIEQDLMEVGGGSPPEAR